LLQREEGASLKNSGKDRGWGGKGERDGPKVTWSKRAPSPKKRLIDRERGKSQYCREKERTIFYTKKG